jgi:NAD(P)-dependent dehydrogenase (short-subunit alcohol dehydrogenase family)
VARSRATRRGDEQAIQRVAVITGGSSGIGAGIARALAARGWRCVLVARGRERLEAIAREVDGEIELCDVSVREQVEQAAAAIAERHPAVHLLVNNAGVPARHDFLRAEPELIEAVLRTNYLGGVWCLRAFLPALERGRPSRVVNVVSVAGTVALPPAGPYSAAKHAQLAFSRATAAQLSKRGIRVHTVNPGFIETEGFPQAALLRNRLLRKIVVGPERVAEHVIAVLDRNHGETYVPAWYRIAPLTQAFAPGLLARLLARGEYRTIPREPDR